MDRTLRELLADAWVTGDRVAVPALVDRVMDAPAEEVVELFLAFREIAMPTLPAYSPRPPDDEDLDHPPKDRGPAPRPSGLNAWRKPPPLTNGLTRAPRSV